jgi:ribonuclease MRP protein subunit RMP1
MAGMTLPRPADAAPVKTPSISATALLNVTQHEKSMLVDVQELLDKLFVRNRNQHRRSHWWKSLHQFRRQLALLLQDMEATKKSERKEKVEARLRFWDENCIHQWY